jgi:hypothetical protein
VHGGFFAVRPADCAEQKLFKQILLLKKQDNECSFRTHLTNDHSGCRDRPPPPEAPNAGATLPTAVVPLVDTR